MKGKDKRGKPCDCHRHWWWDLNHTKWMLACGVEVGGMILTWNRMVTGAEFVTLSIAVVSAYIVGNVAQKIIDPKDED